MLYSHKAIARFSSLFKYLQLRPLKRYFVYTMAWIQLLVVLSASFVLEVWISMNSFQETYSASYLQGHQSHLHNFQEGNLF